MSTRRYILGVAIMTKIGREDSKMKAVPGSPQKQKKME